MLAADVFDAFKEAGLDNESEQAVIGKRLVVSVLSHFRSMFCSLLYILENLTVTFEPRHEKTCFAICKQQICRSACVSAQSDQCLCCSLLG